MADIYMHSRLADDVIQQREQEFDQATVFLGAQSSDPMYYATFHKQGKQYRYYADRMHDTDTQKLLIHLVEYVKQHRTTYTYSFLVGFICHYALDVTIHPYVYHHVGVFDATKPETTSYRGLHLKFERSIDAQLYQQETNKPSRTLQLTKYYARTKVPHNDVLQMMKASFANQFDVSDGDIIYQTCVRHMYNIVKWMVTDRFGIKKQLFKLADLVLRQQDLYLQDLSMFNHVEDYDFLNTSHQTWHHPITNEPSTKSVPEMYQEAIKRSHSILDQVDDYLAGKAIDLTTVFTNLSFNSGLSCDHPEQMKHFHIYRPKNN